MEIIFLQSIYILDKNYYVLNGVLHGVLQIYWYSPNSVKAHAIKSQARQLARVAIKYINFYQL